MLIHCTMDELLAIRDGQGSQGALRHLDECDECCNELELLHQRVAALRALPGLRSPRDRWSVVRDEVLAQRARTRRRFGGWLTAAAAASVALAIGLGGLVTPAAQEPDPLAELVSEAQMLERALRTMRPETRVLTGRIAGAVAALEDRLKRGDKSLVGNKGYRKYLKATGKRFQIDRQKMGAETLDKASRILYNSVYDRTY